MSATQTPIDPIAHDSRTNLPHRDAFYQDLQRVITDVDQQRISLVLLVIDVDGLEFILRTFGPQERDSVIGELGSRIQRVTREESPAYYITQGRFAVVLQGRSYRQATQVARTLVEGLGTAVEVAGISYRLRVRAGISHYPNHAVSAAELVRTGVFACNQAGQSQSDYATFDREWDERERYRFRLLVDLEAALDSPDQLRLAYQPQIELNSGSCVGVEGLCRWHHPEFGPVAPGDFLPFVENTPMMMPLSEAILSQAFEDMSLWRHGGYNGSLAINLSPVLFREPDFLDRLLEHTRFFDAGLEQVHFEVTETGIMDQPNRASNMLQQIRERGSRVAVDDFGTGHSSLAYLADLPVDDIKIDKFFVQNIDHPWGEAIVGAAATLADKLGMNTVAEGIETQQQYDRCRDLGVTIGQGFYMSRPMFHEQFQEWLGA